MEIVYYCEVFQVHQYRSQHTLDSQNILKIGLTIESSWEFAMILQYINDIYIKASLLITAHIAYYWLHDSIQYVSPNILNQILMKKNWWVKRLLFISES